MGRNMVFFDDRHVQASAGLHLSPVPVTKHGVLFDRASPADLGGVSVFAGSVCTLDDGRFRMYYYMHQRHPRVMRIAIAESADGFRWERLPLGQLTWEGEPTSHIRILGLPDDANVTQPSVVRLADGTWRMYCWLHAQEQGMIRYLICDSPDGLVWTTLGIDRPAIFHPSDLEVGHAGWTAGLTNAAEDDRFGDRRTWEFLKAKRLRSNDATNVYVDPETGLFEMYSVWLLPNAQSTGRQTPHDNCPPALRVIHRRTSDDGIHFGDPELVIMPDDGDPLTQQFYYLSTHRQDDWIVGFLGNYHCWEQTMELEICFSRDGSDWRRPLRGGFIPREPAPRRGCMSAYATNALLPVENDRWLMLYRAGNTKHNHLPGPGVENPWFGVMGATWSRGRFAGLATSGNVQGRLLTRPVIQSAPSIAINADIRGSVRAELRDPIGTRIPGFELHNCRPVTGDQAHAELRWGDQAVTSERFRYDAVQLYLELNDAILYSVTA